MLNKRIESVGAGECECIANHRLNMGRHMHFKSIGFVLLH